jgi:lambda family phage portal protein
MRIFTPVLAAKRDLALARLGAAKRLYEAAKTTNYRPKRGTGASGDAVMEAAGSRLREMSRHLYENHDLAVGVIEDIVNNTVGVGVTVEPMVARANGELLVKANDQLKVLWKEWKQTPEVTGELGFGEVERAVCRSMLRDGEILVQHVTQPAFRYRTKVRYAIEMIEADLLPFDLDDLPKGLRHGVEKDAWGRPIAYHILYEHPGDTLYSTTRRETTKRVPAEAISHIKFVRRVKQTRGVPILAPALTRLDDLYDYEASERIAARVASSLAMFIRKSPDFQSDAVDEDGERTFAMEKGMIFDGLLPGEDIGVISSDRPNAALGEFRNAMMKAVAAGTGTRYSSISRSYDGTYSSQRQELIEARTGYQTILDYLITAFYQPTWRNFVATAAAQGLVDLRGADPDTVASASFRGPVMPWIDPLKEMQGYQAQLESRLASRHSLIRQMGGDPMVVDKEIAADPYPEEYGKDGMQQETKSEGQETEEEVTEKAA